MLEFLLSRKERCEDFDGAVATHGVRRLQCGGEGRGVDAARVGATGVAVLGGVHER